MVTPRRARRNVRLGLPWAARKYLLGARPYFIDDDMGTLRNSGIVRWHYLIARIVDDVAWQKYLRDLEAEWQPVIAAERLQWAERKALAKERRREARRPAAEARRARRAVTEALPP
jgi:hypothetical protein